MANVPGLCPPTKQTSFDVNSATSCVAMCQQLFQAYVNQMSGTQRIVVRFGERWTEYNRANGADLLVLYMTLYTQCPAAAAAGLPNLNPNMSVKRGAPARGFQTFPRL
jgi:hypothetical protein